MSRNSLIPIFGSGAQNDLTKRKSIHAIERHFERNADGTSFETERSIESVDERVMAGDQWLWNPNKPDRDKDRDHFREDKLSVLVKEKRTEFDVTGKPIKVDEKAVKTEDFWSSHGTKLIENAPDLSPDNRIPLLNQFASGTDSFKLLGNNEVKNLLEGGNNV